MGAAVGGAGSAAAASTPSRCSPARARAASSTSCPATPSRCAATSPPACARSQHPKLAHGLRRHPRGVARARPGVPRGGLGPRPRLLSRARRAAAAAGRRDRPRRRRHRRGAARGASPASTLPKFRDGGLLHRPRRRRGRPVLSSIIGGWANGAAGSQPVTDGGRAVDVVAPRPDGRAHAGGPPAGGRASTTSTARSSACSTSASRGATCSSTGSRRCSRERGADVRRYAKPTFTKPAPADLRHELAVACDVVIEALAD